MATVHPDGGMQWLAALAVGAAIAAGTLAALARTSPPAAAPLALAAVVAGATRADNAWIPVAAFAVAALVPLVAVAIAEARPSRAVVALAGATALAVAARVVLRDPFRELDCEPFCDPNPFLFTRREDLVSAAEWLLAAVSAAALALQVVRTHARHAAQIAAWAAAAIWTLHLAIRPRPIPGSRLDVALEAVLFAAVAAFAGARGRQAWAALAVRRQMQLFGRTLAAAHDVAGIETSLRRATGDAGLTVALGTPGSSDADIAAGTTSVVRNGQTVAVIRHRPDRVERVAAAVTPSVALALETQVLLDQARWLVAEVDDSRARAAHSTDGARRALERNLHDGAQQHLLVVGMALADAADREVDGDGGRYRAAAADLTDALRELRRIGRGDAATIAELGLTDAATALAGRAPVPISSRVEMCAATAHMCWPTTTATAAYRLLVSTVAEAVRGGATVVEFAARCLGPNGGRLVTIQHDGSADANRAIDRDRVLAAGGRVEFIERPGQRNVEAWLP
jgi:hypothetical protein